MFKRIQRRVRPILLAWSTGRVCIPSLFLLSVFLSIVFPPLLLLSFLSGLRMPCSSTRVPDHVLFYFLFFIFFCHALRCEKKQQPAFAAVVATPWIGNPRGDVTFRRREKE